MTQYTIGETARRLGVAPSTLRYYDKEGLIPFVARSQGGIRLFNDSDCEALKVINCLKASGMQLKDIKKFIFYVMQGDASIDARLQLFEKQKSALEKQKQQLQQTIDTVDFKCWYYETAKKAGTCAVPDSMSDDELPEKLRAIRKRLRDI